MFDIVDLAVQEPEGIIVTITLWHTTGLNAWPYRENSNSRAGCRPHTFASCLSPSNSAPRRFEAAPCPNPSSSSKACTMGQSDNLALEHIDGRLVPVSFKSKHFCFGKLVTRRQSLNHRTHDRAPGTVRLHRNLLRWGNEEVQVM